MFKNAMLFRIESNWSASLAQIESGLDKARFVPCTASQEQAVGWVEPRAELHGALVESINEQLILKFMLESKVVPAAIVKRKIQEMAVQIEAATGRKPGRKEIKELKEDAVLALLPMAFSRESSVFVWIDRANHLLLIDTVNQKKADIIISALVDALDGLVIKQINTHISPAVAMAQWLMENELLSNFSIDRECELKANDESGSVVRYSKHALDIEEIRQHINSGKMPTRLALIWNDRIAFTLTEGLLLKKIKFLEDVYAEKSDENSFDADVVIFTSESINLIKNLLESLGGEV